MIKISDIVSEIIQGDEVALEAYRAGFLNLSAYAKKIQPLISKRLYKPVNTGTIVTALSRIRKIVNNFPPLKPNVTIEDMSIKSPLTEISYEKTMQTILLTRKLDEKFSSNEYFCTITQGIGEISLIVSSSLKKKILEHYNIKPKGIYDYLVAITIRFIEQDYIEVPNMIFTMVAALASKRINLIEIVSTFTEISFVVREKEMKETITALNQFFKR